MEVNDVSSISNSVWMWVACAIPVALVVIQAIVFARKAYKSGPQVGLTKTQLNTAIRSSAITSIGPSIVILAGMITLMIRVGSPMAWMRLSLIGSVMYEQYAAYFGTLQAGVEMTDPMTVEALVLAVWTMILGSIGWVLFSTITANRMDSIQKKIAKGSGAVLMAIAGAAILGVFSSATASYLVKFEAANDTYKNMVSCIIGGVVMAVMILITNKLKAKRLAEWNLTISIIVALIITVLLPSTVA